jgi:hypothetical protein
MKVRCLSGAAARMTVWRRRRTAATGRSPLDANVAGRPTGVVRSPISTAAKRTLELLRRTLKFPYEGLSPVAKSLDACRTSPSCGASSSAELEDSKLDCRRRQFVNVRARLGRIERTLIMLDWLQNAQLCHRVHGQIEQRGSPQCFGESGFLYTGSEKSAIGASSSHATGPSDLILESCHGGHRAVEQRLSGPCHTALKANGLPIDADLQPCLLPLG